MEAGEGEHRFSHNTGDNIGERQEQPQSQSRSATAVCAQCPLHIAMQRLTRAAVSQLVYYADGEYVPRSNLLAELDRWQRLHAAVATRICPAGRKSPITEDELRAAQGLVPEAQYTALRETLRACGERNAGDACPLDGESELEPFSEWP